MRLVLYSHFGSCGILPGRPLFVTAQALYPKHLHVPMQVRLYLQLFELPGARVWCIACAAHQLVVAPFAYFFALLRLGSGLSGLEFP